MHRNRRRKTWQLSDKLSLRAPIIQAPLGICDGPRLAAAVSRAGALGCLTVHNTTEPILSRQLATMRSRTPSPILLAFTAQWQRDSLLNLCINKGFHHFQVFWWNGPRLSRQIQEAGGLVFWQVGSPDQAREAIDVGADILIVQGTEAGGQVRSPYPLAELYERVRTITPENIPIVAGGGLGDVNDVNRVLSWGASAAMMGTRFLLSEEAQADSRCKERLLRSTSADLLLDPRMVGDWPCAPRRRLVTAQDEDHSCWFSGLGISRIHKILPAAEIVRLLTPKDHV